MISQPEKVCGNRLWNGCGVPVDNAAGLRKGGSVWRTIDDFPTLSTYGSEELTSTAGGS